MLKDMSETEMHESWFSDSTMESVILHWVDSDNYEPLPIHRDDLKIVTPVFYERLKLLRQKCGGWLFKAPVTRQILFAADPNIDEPRWKRDSSGTYRHPSFWRR